MRAMPEDTIAPEATEERPLVSDHAWRNPLGDGVWPHGLQLAVALHTAGGTSDEAKASDHETELVLKGKVRHDEERYLPVSNRLALQKAPVAGQEHASLLGRPPDQRPV